MEDLECEKCGGDEFTVLTDDINQTFATCTACGEQVHVGDKK